MKKLVLLAMLTSTICATAFAQEVAAPAPEAKPRFDVGAGYWWTSGTMDSFVYADSDEPGFWAEGDKISELNNDLDAGLFVINAEAYLFWRLYADAFIGWGDFEGEHKDYDWFPEISPDPVSLSKSDADGDVTIWNINGYVRVIEQPEDKGYLDVSLGYLSYQDDIEHLRNTTLEIWLWDVINEPIAGHDSQSKYTFDGIRLGARGKIRLHDRIAVKASGGIVPWANVEEDAYWNLREMDILGEADGTIFDLNIGLEFKITKYLFVELGYKYFNLDSDRGDDTRTFADGSSFTIEDGFEADGERGGFYAMGRLKI